MDMAAHGVKVIRAKTIIGALPLFRSLLRSILLLIEVLRHRAYGGLKEIRIEHSTVPEEQISPNGTILYNLHH